MSDYRRFDAFCKLFAGEMENYIECIDVDYSFEAQNGEVPMKVLQKKQTELLSCYFSYISYTIPFWNHF